MAKNWRFHIQSKCVLNNKPENVMEGYKNRDYMDIITYNHAERFEFFDVTDMVVYPIETKEEYNYVCLHFGYTGTSKYWIFWVPSQYIKAMQEVVVGNWPGL